VRSESAGLRLVFGVRGEQREAALQCEADVFGHWYGNSREQLAEAYEEFEPETEFLTVLDEHDEAVAAARIIASRSGRLKTLEDVQRPPWSLHLDDVVGHTGVVLDSCWDIATLGVRPQLRSRGLYAAAALYHGLIAATRVNLVRSVVAILDDRVRSVLGSVSLDLRPIPGAGSADYLGSANSTPVFGHCADMVDRQRRTNPEAYRFVTQGIGLDMVELGAEEDFRLPVLVDLRDPEPAVVRLDTPLSASRGVR
jgi:hypothetical protein